MTVVTGFLGAGKTTLLNQLLRGAHGRRLAVIVNDFAAAGIDGELIESGEEELIELNDGCLCCSIRGDLVRALHGLLPRLDGLDGILIETTGLADPGPVAQTFLVDPVLRARLELDSVTAVIDARHVAGQLAREAEARAQAAFADQLVLNKIDLVDAATLADVRAHLRALNPHAPLIETTRGAVAPERIFGRHGFDLRQVAALLAPAACCGDPHCDGDHPPHSRRDAGAPGPDPTPGPGPDLSAVVVEGRRPMDPAALSDWLGRHLAEHGAQTLRVKGIVEATRDPRRLAFQAVHMLLEGDFLGPWPPGPRTSRIVFIGRGLDAAALQAGFDACAASEKDTAA